MTPTPQQTRVLQLLAQGLSNKQVAGEMGLSRRTVETHRTKVMRRLNLHGTAQLVHYAIQYELVRCGDIRNV